jgi:hypothetical protein
VGGGEWEDGEGEVVFAVGGATRQNKEIKLW